MLNECRHIHIPLPNTPLPDSNEAVFYEMIRLLRSELGKDYTVGIEEEEGLTICKSNLANPDVPIDIALISEEERQSVMDCIERVRLNILSRIAKEKTAF